ncbi:S8 family serine peptidase [Aeoliella mucimassa]|uniref:Subtilisin BL n=1 Tax=Aeoliella mucimassa TaxID=2527972 RepID=A0A518AHC4_9BACT|nr:S8 family serine peptidase [Aeoliella mucimassa]QDU54127.1 Subtilisin BL [Aeoliella mucimassa]
MGKKRASHTRPQAEPPYQRAAAELRQTASTDTPSLFSRSGSPELETTGRVIMTAVDNDPDAVKRIVRDLKNRAGISNTLTLTAGDESASASDDVEATVLSEFGIVIVDAAPDQIVAAESMVQGASAPAKEYCHVEREYYCYTASDIDELQPSTTGRTRDYWIGYKAGVSRAVDEILLDFNDKGISETTTPSLSDEGYIPLDTTADESMVAGQEFTWGLQATRVSISRLNGQGVKAAVLDTGIDLRHPDFQGRIAASRSFVQGLTVQDGNGHGTHCAGTLGGSSTAGTIRYGVAPAVELYIGKVLNNQGRGREGDVVQGIHWALGQGCRVISVSIQRRVIKCQVPVSIAYETAGANALRRGALVIAAAGNHSNRQSSQYVPVSAPANCPSIVGVGAISQRRRLANFTNRAFCKGGDVDFVAPGVDIYSSDVTPNGYRSRNGTSMATPHVSGIAALIVQQEPGVSGQEIYNQLRANALGAVGGSTRDFGHGLARALV